MQIKIVADVGNRLTLPINYNHKGVNRATKSIAAKSQEFR